MGLRLLPDGRRLAAWRSANRFDCADHHRDAGRRDLGEHRDLRWRHVMGMRTLQRLAHCAVRDLGSRRHRQHRDHSMVAVRRGERMITQEELKRLVDYDPQTGILRAKIRRGTSKDILGCRAVRGATTYLRVVIGSRYYYAHRLAWLYVHGEWPRLIDHTNGDGCDNRIANLREASHSANHGNTKLRRDNKTGFKGVSIVRSGKFYACIRKNGKSINLGYFDTPGEAHAAYCVAANRMFGDFANAGHGS